ncbi:MAG: cobyric acid synthase [Oscillospiraceae bacterium]
MAKSIMIQGTTSSAGQSLITAGLCRIFKQDGYRVAPFKSQNMSLNSYITKEGLEMGRAQVMQAEACGIVPDVRMNPILLKPTSDQGSQVILSGTVMANMTAKEYFSCKTQLIPQITKSYESLCEEYDIIVIEGAGSPAEINLKQQDIVNMGMARIANAPVLIVGDIDRGGVFAALAGTMLLLEEDEKKRVKGTIINKFRGDLSILQSGLATLESITNVPVLGVVPYLQIEIDDEDSLTDRFALTKANAHIDIVVIHLPHISNFTDFNPLSYLDGVSIRYVRTVQEFKNPDFVILPGTKNTMEDLLWLRQCGLETTILKYAATNKPLMGICGGYQMLGQRMSDPHNVEHGGNMMGLGLLPYDTIFEKEKTCTQNKSNLSVVDGIFKALSNAPYEGYEIHMGLTDTTDNIVHSGNVYGTYIHGFFDKESIIKVIVRALFEEKGLDFSNTQSFDLEQFKQTQYDLLADCLRQSLDMQAIYKLLEDGMKND